MYNKHHILRVPYIYIPAMRDMDNIEKLRKQLLEPLIAPRIILFPLIRKSFREYYRVTNKSTLMNKIFSLYFECITEDILQSVLIEIYLKYENEFLSINVKNIEVDFLNDKYINSVTSRFKIIDNGLFPSLENFNYPKMIRQRIINYFESNEDTRIDNYKFFEQNKEWLPLVKKVGFSGFRFVQIMTVIDGGVSCFYISKKFVDDLLTTFGKIAEDAFQDWQEFFASCILGKWEQMRLASEKPLDPNDKYPLTDQNEYLFNIKNVINAKIPIYEISDLWAHSDFSTLINLIEPHSEQLARFEKKSFPVLENEFDYINDLIEPIFKNNEYDDFFEFEKNQRCLYIKKDGFLDFSSRIEEISSYLSHDEVLLMVSKMGGGLFTNKSVIYKNGGMFNKTYEVIEWKQINKIEGKVTGLLSDISIFLNENKVFEIPTTAKNLGITEKEYNKLSKKELNEHIENYALKWEKIFIQIRDILIKHSTDGINVKAANINELK